ncbi:MAG: ATP-binding protein [Anaerobacillus sp.]|uniref:ATP-binding protein n=1 Tax=Anaerobacillus sp. TaxID=1872506 RepID=UPI00391C216B
MSLIIELERFLLNLSFVFLLFFVYHRYVEKRINLISNEIFLSIISGISIILCMTFTLSPTPGIILDLRLLPLMVGALYCGRRVAFFLVVVAIVYRFYLGFDIGFYANMILYSTLYCILWFIIPKFSKSQNLKDRLLIAIGVSIIWIIIFRTIMYGLNIKLSVTGEMTLVLMFVAQFFGALLFITFIENTRKDRLLLNELNKLEKLKIVSEIAASISHEVRNPLTVTKGFLQLLKERGISEKKKNMYITLSLEELERAEEIITDYLTFAKPSLENIEMLEVNKELDYIVNVLAPFATMSNVNINIEKSELIYILGERQKFHQAVINLAKNGIEAMNDGGELTIKLAETETSAIVIIEDTGSGMDHEQLDRLGTPYYSTKEKGTGLGTMVVFSIIKVMGGEIAVESVVGEGTTFKIIVPKVKIDSRSVKSNKTLKLLN